MTPDEQERKNRADDIRLAIQGLNVAITQAAKFGVRIEEMEEIDATEMRDRCRAIIYHPVIVWKETL